jgi:hypothetical protein
VKVEASTGGWAAGGVGIFGGGAGGEAIPIISSIISNSDVLSPSSNYSKTYIK